MGWLGLIAMVVLGGVAIYGLVDKTMRDRRKDVNAAADDLVGILSKTVEELKAKVGEMEKDLEKTNIAITELKKENETLVKVLQGRDDATLKFQQEVLEAVQLGEETNRFVKEMAESFGNLRELVPALQKLTATIESSKK